MKKNKFILVITIILVGLASYLLLNRSNSTLKVKDAAFAVRDTAAIRKVFIADMVGNNLSLDRKAVDHWTVNDEYKVNQELIRLLLKTIKNIRVLRPVSNAGFENILKQLATTSTKVEIYKTRRKSRIDLVRVRPLE